MKVLVFDRKIETLIFLCDKIMHLELRVVTAENGSKFLASLLSENFDAVIISRNELSHYNCSGNTLFKKIKRNILFCTYEHDHDCFIKKVKIIVSNPNAEFTPQMQEYKTKLKALLLKCKHKMNDQLSKTFIYSLPKKSAILLKHLILNKHKGITDEEIAYLFWGEYHSDKQHCIYNHIYNLKKTLKTEFKNAYTIYKDKNRYRLVNFAKEA